ncbi:hypothetical protein K9K77_01015 [Candidatus Babeliales bacterium]|nr:hypothetical protein [Candidatus Babeliales bacterium]
MKCNFVFLFLFINFSFSFTKDIKKRKISESVQIVMPDDILFRFYCLNRLKDSIACLFKVSHNYTLPCSLEYHFDTNMIHLGNKTYKNKCIILTIQEMNKHNSIKPFLYTWKTLKHYKYLESSGLIKEFITLLMYLLSHFVEEKYFEQCTYKNLDFLESLDDKEISDILDVLDLLTEEVLVFCEKYEIHSDIDWKKWFKQYSIPAALSLAAIAIKVYLNYRNFNNIESQENIFAINHS